MILTSRLLLLLLAGLTASLTVPRFAAADDKLPWPETNFEIFKLAPGKQEAFIRSIAKADEAFKSVGLPPMQVYLHKAGADWDVLLLKPQNGPKLTSEQLATLDAKRRELGVPTGLEAFLDLREKVAAHTDTITTGPIAAADWLARLDADRAAARRPQK